MSTDDKDSKVRAVLLASTAPLGPTEIARRIDEDCCAPKDSYPKSSAIVPILRRIGAQCEGGKYSLPAQP